MENNSSKNKRIIITLALVAGLFVVYIGFGVFFKSHFAFNTSINSTKVSLKDTKVAYQRLLDRASGYSLSLMYEDGTCDALTSEQLGLRVDIQPEMIERCLAEQNAFAWPIYLIKGHEFVDKEMVACNEAAVEDIIKNLDGVKKSGTKPTKNADIRFNNNAFETVAEEYGNSIDLKALKNAVVLACIDLEEEVDLIADDCYVKPSILAEDKRLQAAVDTANDYIRADITYLIGDDSLSIDRNTIAGFVKIDSECNVIVDSNEVAEYVKELAKEYNTTGKPIEFKTNSGEVINIRGNYYGWKIDIDGETAQLSEDIMSGKKVRREFVYAQTANSHDKKTYGDSYIEVSIGDQHMWVYKDGQVVLETPVVTGSVNGGHATHTGAFYIAYKQRDRILRGPDYETPVKYWMPFNGGEGFHDAGWRSNFGGTIYINSGSHGCVNMPPARAAELYDMIEAGWPVFVYNLKPDMTVEQQVIEALDLAAYDQATTMAAATVDNMISSISFSVTAQCAQEVRAARVAYGELDAGAKQKVAFLQQLENMENSLRSYGLY